MITEATNKQSPATPAQKERYGEIASETFAPKHLLPRCLLPVRALRTLPTNGTAMGSGQDFPHCPDLQESVAVYRKAVNHCGKGMFNPCKSEGWILL